ncbi:hypothetical protein [Salinibacter phage M8CRM-1]|uniref:Uncharacterized protein n=3 Tax=Kryptosalinivirus TaxID=2560163 RepID=A0A2I6UGC0_9CAUD|nr:hypothetical protein FGG63_gp64 [Salinibacter phage M8CC-19]YP_009639530.1 hypothetical protein FGG67_gp64 [Salinibacter phage M8CRM-1]AUO79025.1 hypothetical protein [Salinibacter phage M8CC-19]AUO79185.1 hypothetical protein [Salinibacter phage M8CRM-1]AUO79258.1 hypothetical protein [Salinibacter phage M31CC-1]
MFSILANLVLGYFILSALRVAGRSFANALVQYEEIVNN